MTQQMEVEWPTCEKAGCIGVRVATSRMCLAHCSDEERDAALKLIGDTGVIDQRGVPMTSALIGQVLDTVPHGEDGQPLIGKCRFDRATFSGEASFGGATFNGAAEFRGAIFSGRAEFGWATFNGWTVFDEAAFNGHASFDGAAFKVGGRFIDAAFSGDASFSRADFGGDAEFEEATFSHYAGFEGANFSGRAGFIDATFNGAAVFDKATFGGDAGFVRVDFGGYAGFGEVTFSGDAWFDGVDFGGDAVFGGTNFGGDAWFQGARFEQTRQFGPMLVCHGLMLDEVQFMQQVRIEASSTVVCCRRSRFPGGVYFRLRWARIVLDDTDLAMPSIIAGAPHLPDEELAQREEQTAKVWQQELGGEISERPQLLSLRRANVAGLGLSNVSAVDCRFAGAHNLDKLRLESDVGFSTAPLPLGLAGQKWAGRQVIAEERAWRTGQAWRAAPTSSSDPGATRRRWVAPWWAARWPLEGRPGMLGPGQIAELYRALRKGREDIKDEPGAADFYYGEMEMRRHARPGITKNPGDQVSASSRGRVERVILTVYWLVSGYGLRAWRALACLALVTALLALAFHLAGFTVPPHPDTYWTSLLYSFRATLSLTDNDVKLTAWGQLLQGILRLSGPVLLGLALLALRGRVKR